MFVHMYTLHPYLILICVCLHSHENFSPLRRASLVPTSKAANTLECKESKSKLNA